MEAWAALDRVRFARSQAVRRLQVQEESSSFLELNWMSWDHMLHIDCEVPVEVNLTGIK